MVGDGLATSKQVEGAPARIGQQGVALVGAIGIGLHIRRNAVAVRHHSFGFGADGGQCGGQRASPGEIGGIIKGDLRQARIIEAGRLLQIGLAAAGNDLHGLGKARAGAGGINASIMKGAHHLGFKPSKGRFPGSRSPVQACDQIRR